MWPAKPKELPTPVLKGWVIPEAKPPHLGPRRHNGLNPEIQCILAKEIFFSKQQAFCIFLQFKTSRFKLDDKLHLKPYKKYKN